MNALAEQPVDDLLFHLRVRLQVAHRQVDAERLVGGRQLQLSLVEDGVTLAFSVPFRFDGQALEVVRIVAGSSAVLAQGSAWTASSARSCDQRRSMARTKRCTPARSSSTARSSP